MQLRKSVLVSLLILSLATLALNPQMRSAQSYGYPNISDEYTPVFHSPDDYTNISSAFNLRNHQPVRVVDGLNYIPIFRNEIIQGDPATFNAISSGSFVFEMDGSVIFTYNDETRNTVSIPYNSSTLVVDKGSLIDNVTLYNIYTGAEEVLPISGVGVVDLVYNPDADTFLVLKNIISNTLWDGLNVSYQNIIEYDSTGQQVWAWDAETNLPFNSNTHTLLGLNETHGGYADWMHANSMVLNVEDDQILLLVRNHDTIYNINKTDGETIWSAGRLGDFTVMNELEQTVDTIWWHPSSLKYIGENTYLIFDSDARNITNPDSMALLDGNSRYLEFSVDAAKEEVHELWSFTAPDSSYYSPDSGSVSRLPDGNTVGVFGNRGDAAVLLNDTHPIYFTEVNDVGEILWEVEMENTTQFAYQTSELQRVYGSPIVQLESASIVVDMGQTPEVNLVTWDCMPSIIDTQATLRIAEDGFEDSFDFLANHEPQVVTLLITGLSVGEHDFTLEIENQDGITTTVDFSVTIEFNLGVVLGISITAGVLILASCVLFIRQALIAKNAPTPPPTEIIVEAESVDADEIEKSEDQV